MELSWLREQLNAIGSEDCSSALASHPLLHRCPGCRVWPDRRPVCHTRSPPGAVAWIGGLARNSPSYHPLQHFWHIAGHAGQSVLIWSILATIWRPRRKPLIVQFALVFAVIELLIIVVGALFFELRDPVASGLVFFIPILALALAVSYPAPRSLLTFEREVPISWPLLTVAVVVAVGLGADAVINAVRELTRTVSIAGAALFSATARAGSRSATG